MKTIIMALALLSSVSAFATGRDCAGLIGSYSCSYHGEKLPLILSLVDTYRIKLEFAGETEVFMADGLSHKAEKGSDYVKVTCSAEEVSIENTYRTQTTALVSISKTATGVDYVLVQQGRDGVELSCVKVK